MDIIYIILYYHLPPESSTENEFIAEIAGDVISWIGLKIGPTGGRVWVDDMKSAYHNLQC